MKKVEKIEAIDAPQGDFVGCNDLPIVLVLTGQCRVRDRSEMGVVVSRNWLSLR
jgi:hypothetical protein